MKHRAVCPECGWAGEPKLMNAAARDVGEHRDETGHAAKVERAAVTDGGQDADGIHQTPDQDVLDATCGGRSIWFDENKEREDTLYVDNREEPAGFVDEAVANPPNNPNYAVEPDEMEDFRDLPYPAESFDLVVFDPPHIVRSDGMKTLTGVLTKKYGCLHAETWQDDLRRGFLELFRVLRPGGTMVFKFCDESVDFETVTDLAPEPPLFGTTVRGGGSKIETRWFVFRKERDRDE